MFSQSNLSLIKNVLALCFVVLALVGCSDDEESGAKSDTSGATSGSDTSGVTSGSDTSGVTSGSDTSGGTTENDTSGATTENDTSGGGDDTSGAGISYTANVQPIYQEKCAPCHTGAVGCSGAACFGAVYADTQNQAGACAGLTVGECTLQRIQAGSMPLGAGCSGDPATDAANGACLTAEQQQTIQDWIDAGMPE